MDPDSIVAASALSRGSVRPPASSLSALTSGSFLVLLLLVLFAVNVVLHYPGTMSNDSNNQYAEAISGHYSDWHPPVMAWLWSILRMLADGPAPFLLLHLAVYWAGFGLLADGTRRAGMPRLALLIALAGAFPPFLYLNGTVAKDVGMVSSWLAAVGLMFWFRAQGRRIPLYAWTVVAALIFYGTLVRGNALFGLGPLLLYAMAPASWLRNTRLIAGALIVAVLAIPVTQQLNRVLFHPEARNPVYSLFLFDLLGMATHARDPGLLEPRATLSAEDLKTCYTPYWWDSLSPWGHCGARVHRPDDNHATYGDGLAVQWAKAIAAHPLAYAEHRLKHFNSAILFAVPPKHIRLTPEFRASGALVTEREIKFDLLRKNPLTWPATWLAWAAGLLLVLGRETGNHQVLLARVLLVSAIGYSLAYLVIGVATDMRYHYWSLIAILVATLLTLPQLADKLRRRSALLAGALAFTAGVVAIGVATRLLDYQRFVF